MSATAWEHREFLEVFEDISNGHKKTKQADYLRVGHHPIVDQGKNLIAGYSDDLGTLSHADLPVIIFGDHTRCFKFIDFPFGVGADGVKVLRVDEGIDPRYAYHFLKTLRIEDNGYSRHFKFLKLTNVPVPPLDEQKRIAGILDAADQLRSKRQQTIDRLETLTHAIFNDMFGDPLLNTFSWPEAPLGSLAAKFSDGPFGSNLKSDDYVDDGIRVVRLQNIGVDEFLDDDRAYISNEHFSHLIKHECLPGDVLVGTLGDPNLRACIQPDWLAVAINKADCVQIRVNESLITPEWLCSLLNNPATELKALRLVRGQTRARISMGRLRDLEVPIPPLPLQLKFTELVKALRSDKLQRQHSTATFESLFASLQQRAFRGDL